MTSALSFSSFELVPQNKISEFVFVDLHGYKVMENELFHMICVLEIIRFSMGSISYISLHSKTSLKILLKCHICYCKMRTTAIPLKI